MLSQPRYQGPAMIIGWTGRVDGDNADQFEEQLTQAARGKGQYVVVDGDRTDYVSSAGIRAFLLVAQDLSQNDQVMALCNLTPDVKKIFTTIGFDELLPIHDSIEEAIAAAPQNRTRSETWTSIG